MKTEFRCLDLRLHFTPIALAADDPLGAPEPRPLTYQTDNFSQCWTTDGTAPICLRQAGAEFIERWALFDAYLRDTFDGVVVPDTLVRAYGPEVTTVLVGRPAASSLDEVRDWFYEALQLLEARTSVSRIRSIR